MPERQEIVDAFAARPPHLRSSLLALRRLILEVAASMPEVGPIEESLKWGQPSYLTSASKSGTTIRVDQHAKLDERCALFVSCQTDLISTFKEIYPDQFIYSGKRALILKDNAVLPEDALRHCIALALTYKLRKKLEKGRGRRG